MVGLLIEQKSRFQHELSAADRGTTISDFCVALRRIFTTIRDYGTGLGALAKVLFACYLILNTQHFIAKNKNYWLLMMLVFAYAVATVLANEIVIFGRLASVFVGGGTILYKGRHGN